ncbi:Electron transfer protein 1, mitochondrial [Golovinomyces cichoracearum]|uniref:Electron transfer protein 1, mitochondrial n=1 Tax=Golovinomyces cichoracearum TaxID=62708 RepID=A0A420HJB1_9PEZI|nr:Electron transfer protein 1, mitochondrial [Golovinomyces cichoracearum]
MLYILYSYHRFHQFTSIIQSQVRIDKMTLLFSRATKSLLVTTPEIYTCARCSKQRRSISQLRSLFRTNIPNPRTIQLNRSILKLTNFRNISLRLDSKITPFSSNIGENFFKAHTKAKNGFFPETTSKSVAYWLLGSATSVFGIVVLGGLTRLTESGLSITEWKPITGSLPPLSQADWDLEFEKYRASPEFQVLNSHMNLSEFKKIYYMEWGHRQWGRLIGLTFVLPAVYFISRRKVSLPMSLRIISIAGLIGFQGFLGWYMVKSGLEESLFTPGSHPRVSQYRLAAHLGTAFTCFTAMLWNGLAILRTHSLLSYPRNSHALLQQLNSPTLSPFRKSVAALSVLIFTTALSGAFVAGLDAGLIYNQFPRMGEGLHPSKNELFNPQYSFKPDQSDLIWRNMLENPTTVQFDHRILAMTTCAAVLGLWAYSRFNSRIRKSLPNSVRKGMLGVVHLVLLQISLGITTLIYLVPIPLAAMHQAGALALLTGVTVLGSRVWIPKRTWALMKKRLEHSAVVRVNRPEIAQAAIRDIRSHRPPILS